MNLETYLEKETQIPPKTLRNIIVLFEQDATIPFIARYRKDQTGNLDEVALSTILKKKNNFETLEKRKQSILESIQEQDKLTDELRVKIENCYDATQLEDWYLPYKKKRKTLAMTAIDNGLMPLAKIIMKQNTALDWENLQKKYLSREITTTKDALDGAKHIITQWINEHENVRKQLRKAMFHEGKVKSLLIKGKESEENASKFSNYFDFEEPIKRIPAHRLLAVLRGENEGLLRVKLAFDQQQALEIIRQKIIKTQQKEVQNFLETACKEAYTKYLEPSLTTELMQQAKKDADVLSISIFSKNLQQLLLTPPYGEKRILAIDPGFKSGCKVVCLDENGGLLHNENIYPHAPKNESIPAQKKIRSLVNAYQIQAIAIGNGTASRETEHFIQKIAFDRPLDVFVVSEAGASIYSASAIAREEFPDKDVTVRGAVSIGRRLSDPLAELVKINPKSIGIGQYQHDVNQTLLKEELDQTVMFCVNQVGVNLNTANPHLLQYVSGIGKKLAENIVQYRTKNGPFECRKDLLKVPSFGEKAFLQASAFLRIANGKNKLDNSAVHPESYSIVEKIANDLGMKSEDLIGNKEVLSTIEIGKYTQKEMGELYLKDLLKELEKPGLDPRKQGKVFSFNPKIKNLEDLKVGLRLPGIVQNITHFGCFVDVGIKENGLLHVSKIAKEFIADVNSKIHMHQELLVTVVSIDLENRKFQLSLID